MSWRARVAEERPGFLAGVGGVAAEELGVGRIGHRDRQPQLGGGGLEVLEEAGQRGDAAVERLGGGVGGDQVVAPGVDVGDGGLQEADRVLGPADLAEGDEGHDVLAVGPLGVPAGAAGDPGVEDAGDREEELLDAVLDLVGAVPARIGGRSRTSPSGRTTIAPGVAVVSSACPFDTSMLAPFSVLTVHDNWFYHAPSSPPCRGRGLANNYHLRRLQRRVFQLCFCLSFSFCPRAVGSCWYTVS